MTRRQEPPPALRSLASRLGILAAVRGWFLQDGAGDPRRVAAVRCHCVRDGKLVLLRQVHVGDAAFQVGQCPGCHRAVWSPVEES